MYILQIPGVIPSPTTASFPFCLRRLLRISSRFFWSKSRTRIGLGLVPLIGPDLWATSMSDLPIVAPTFSLKILDAVVTGLVLSLWNFVNTKFPAPGVLLQIVLFLFAHFNMRSCSFTMPWRAWCSLVDALTSFYSGSFVASTSKTLPSSVSIVSETVRRNACILLYILMSFFVARASMC